MLFQMTSDIDSQGYQKQHKQQQQQQQHQQQIGIFKYQRFFQGNESYMWQCNILKSALLLSFCRSVQTSSSIL